MFASPDFTYRDAVHTRCGFLFLLAGIFISAWFLQSTLLLNADVSWLLEASKRMLSGGNYATHFFENNPPWILYFYAPVILFASVFPVGLVYSLTIYIFLLSIFSLGLSYLLLKQIFFNSDRVIAKLLLITQAVVMLIFPITDFGQREHLLFILMMPYFFMMALRLQNHPIAVSHAVIIGLLTGAVLMIKPYFLMTLFLVEGYYLLRKERRATNWVRPELFAMLLLLLVYIIILLFRHTDYIHLIMPFALRWCYLGTRNTWIPVLINISTISCFFTGLFYMVTYDINQYKHLTHVLLLGLLGFIFSYLIQKEDWAYHILPATSLSIIINFLLVGMYINTREKPAYLAVFLCIFILMLLVFIDNIKTTLAFDILLHPWIFLGFVSVFVLILSLFKNKVNYGLIAITTGLLFFIPFYDAYLKYDEFKPKKFNTQQLITFINSHALHQSIYFFTTNISHAYPAITYSETTTSSSRFSFLWALPGLLKQASLPMNNRWKNQLSQDRHTLINMIADDLQTKKPELILIDNLKQKNSLGVMAFDYLNYFNENAHFNHAWKNYRYLTSISASFRKPINPLDYDLSLQYRKIPDDSEIKFKTLYLYIRQDDQVEMALKNNNYETIRITMNASLNKAHLSSIHKALSTPGSLLDKKSKLVFFYWVTKQTLAYPFYEFNVYSRVSKDHNY